MNTTTRPQTLERSDAHVPPRRRGPGQPQPDHPYRLRRPPHAAEGRHTDTTEVRLPGITGTIRRPRTALLQLPDTNRAFTPQLDAVQARHIADLLAPQDPRRPGPDETLLLPAPLQA